MWESMRKEIPSIFPADPGLPRSSEAYLKALDDMYVSDAYHSLSIEGYRVSKDLIERVRGGAWNPEQHPEDFQNRDAHAARGTRTLRCVPKRKDKRREGIAGRQCR